nr:MAG TPA: hypothetical protein [Inoviridae sp.]
MKVNFKPFLNRFFRRVGALLSALFSATIRKEHLHESEF